MLPLAKIHRYVDGMRLVSGDAYQVIAEDAIHVRGQRLDATLFGEFEVAGVRLPNGFRLSVLQGEFTLTAKTGGLLWVHGAPQLPAEVAPGFVPLEDPSLMVRDPEFERFVEYAQRLGIDVQMEPPEVLEVEDDDDSEEDEYGGPPLDERDQGPEEYLAPGTRGARGSDDEDTEEDGRGGGDGEGAQEEGDGGSTADDEPSAEGA